MSEHGLYPLRFRPQFVERPWGGQALQRLLGRKIPVGSVVGESWELSDLPGHESSVAGGALSGTSLRTLVERHPEQLLGPAEFRSRGDGRFPLLVKYLDVSDRLSLQVHPDDELAHRREGLSRGKSEAWWVMEAQAEAFVLLGPQEAMAPEQVESDLRAGQLERLTSRHGLTAGDLVCLPAGTLHSAGGGVVMLEIQDTCDVTYRLHDWGRLDSHGIGRPLHLEAGLEALGVPNASGGLHRLSDRIQSGLLANLGRFELWLHQGENRTMVLTSREVPIVFAVVGGNGRLAGEDGSSFRRGDVFLLPAGSGDLILSPRANEHLRVVEARPVMCS